MSRQDHNTKTGIPAESHQSVKKMFRKRKNSTRSAASTKPPKRQKQASFTARPHNNSIDIPERLKYAITKQDKGFYELNFPIASLNGLQRLAWGLDLRAEFVNVCLKFVDGKTSDFVCFCVHSSTDNEDRQLRHRFCSSRGNDPIMTPCSPRSTILTCVLSRELYGLTGLRCGRDLAVIYEKVLQLIKSDPTKNCLICGRDFEKEFQVKLYTPTACSGDCMQKLDKWPLRARLSHLLSDVKTLDFLLCSIYTAVDGQKSAPNLYGTKDSLLVDCPLKLDQIQPTIDSFPKLSDKLGMRDLLLSGSGKLKNSQRQLLSWLSIRARGYLVSLKPGAEFFAGRQSMKTCHQFMLLNSVLERQADFVKSIRKIGVGSVAFHGCKASRTFNILTDALRNMWGKSYVVEDRGIFFSDNPSYSFIYAASPPQPEGLFRAWKRSTFAGQSWAVIFGLEVAMSHIPFRYQECSTLNEGLLMIRYVFLVPTDVPTFSHIDLQRDIKQDVMKKAFRTLEESRLEQQQIGLNVDKSGWKH
ncbi:hypothetical protein VSDG_08601 [Cytospora chrysosperma]|uniref:PARP catalytic domain-containing protein n=1 Tax=Cytospora chrysosperma TaxID=252740 RepID=A0A423VFK6_CYTCH|nr:hypothetical protein VSDG_08601 [Valsa sordida]